MLFKTFSAAVFGIDAYLVEVEVDIGPGSQAIFNVVGLPDNAVRESRERVRAALRNCGFDYPFIQTITVNLARADVGKEGPGVRTTDPTVSVRAEWRSIDDVTIRMYIIGSLL